MSQIRFSLLLLGLLLLEAPGLPAQQSPQPMSWTAAEDHRNMMEQLGIKLVDALKPILTDVPGPPSHKDHAPAPTGDPSARR